MKKLIHLAGALLLIAATSTQAADKRAGLKVLMLGGGASHDYQRWFNEADTAILKEAGAVPTYTENISNLAEAIADADVLYLSNNKPYADEDSKAAVLKHAEAGKGIILVHAGLWYNWKDWPDYNRVLAAGGARGHNKLGEFNVKVTDAHHPIMKDVPDSFDIIDELYWFEVDSDGPPVEVLASAHSESKQKTYPSVFIVKHPKARIVGITLGHDGRAHNLPAYKHILQNALHWVSGKP